MGGYYKIKEKNINLFKKYLVLKQKEETKKEKNGKRNLQ